MRESFFVFLTMFIVQIFFIRGHKWCEGFCSWIVKAISAKQRGEVRGVGGSQEAGNAKG